MTGAVALLVVTVAAALAALVWPALGPALLVGVAIGTLYAHLREHQAHAHRRPH